MGDPNPQTPQYIPPTATPILPPTSAVLQDALARQILKAQEKIQDNFRYSADLDTVYWIRGAANICRETNVRDQSAIARILTSELIKSNPVRQAVESHINNHSDTTEQCSEICLVKFALKEPSLFTKSTSDLTSALGTYKKPQDMDVQEHLVAHLEKEADLFLRREPNASESDIHSALYGTEDTNGKHVPGVMEDSTIARLLDSMRLSEPGLITHLDRMKLFHGKPGWTLRSLDNSIRAYEQDQSAHPPLDTTLYPSATVQHFQAKLQARAQSKSYRPYHLYDPTVYGITRFNNSRISNEPLEPLSKKRKPDSLCREPTNTQSSLAYDQSIPSLIHSITELQSVTQMLKNKYDKPQISNNYNPPRDPTHCIRCGSPEHLIFQCTEENDQKAAESRDYNSKNNAFKPSRRYAQHGTSLAHTWTLRETRWPKTWMKPPSSSKKE